MKHLITTVILFLSLTLSAQIDSIKIQSPSWSYYYADSLDDLNSRFIQIDSKAASFIGTHLVYHLRFSWNDPKLNDMEAYYFLQGFEHTAIGNSREEWPMGKVQYLYYIDFYTEDHQLTIDLPWAFIHRFKRFIRP